MKTPEGKTITFTFHSQPQSDLKAKWKATVTFAGGSADESFARVYAADGEGSPIDGEFEFAGTRISLKRGHGEVRCSLFVSGKHEKGIWMYRAEFSPVPGMLTFE